MKKAEKQQNDNLSNLLNNYLVTKFIGRKIFHYESVSSTMELARTWAKKGSPSGTIVIANRQLSGRGRIGRTWLSPENNVAMTIILHPTLDILPKLIMITSVAVVRAIRTLFQIKAQIKWPNDILINGKKVSGILIENEFQNNRISYSIIGIGINTNLNPASIPEIHATATSLSQESGKDIGRIGIIGEILNEFEALYQQTLDGSAQAFLEWKENMDTVGRQVTINSEGLIIKGLAETVTESGGLILRHPDGTVSEIITGDVTILKE